jgi:superfamily II DNA helicase RecQ/SAM-dependent methyltransferase
MSDYLQAIRSLPNPSFQNICATATSILRQNIRHNWSAVRQSLERGVALLDKEEQLCQYLDSYGRMHQAKLLDAFRRLPDDLLKGPFEIVDWGCGQGLATFNLIEYIRLKGYDVKVRKITLIDPSAKAVERAIAHISLLVPDEHLLHPVVAFLDEITPDQIAGSVDVPQIHLFSNILDIPNIDLKRLARTLDDATIYDNYVVCVSPLISGNGRLDQFYRYFDVPLLYTYATYYLLPLKCSHKCNIFKLDYKKTSNLFPITYYPSVQFSAGFELDMVRSYRKSNERVILSYYTLFETFAPFDLGASVYEDIHPLFAVMHNIIVRGLPTKASPYIESIFSDCFGFSHYVDLRGEFSFESPDSLDLGNFFESIREEDVCETAFQEKWALECQLVFSPIAIAKFQKVLLEAIITGHLDLHKDVWKIMVEEHDVPFSRIALEDFRQLFNHLASMTGEYQDFTLPAFEVTVISNKNFHDSSLHLGNKTFVDPPLYLLSEIYDLVFTYTSFNILSDDHDFFTRFRCHNHAYFTISAAAQKRTERVIYTSRLLTFKPLFQTNDGIVTQDVTQTVHLEYFLRLLFRKASFRVGQLEILDRALQVKPVIGLLPTGGGKSLTYQLAAMLQPGVTIVIDPLRSLMKDQLDGLHRNGIDCAAYLNSSITKEEKIATEINLESSRLLFIFVSPERLSIKTFRERLRNMHDYNVYFSYGVIDEVHCVSEWGHDFRFSYLHLGRNLYTYVRARDKEISLFGLTATASFDVLADVERELSGNGAFKLDEHVIVRHENSDRLELQYKIERVDLELLKDPNYDVMKKMPGHLPSAVKIFDFFTRHKHKKNALVGLINKIPGYIQALHEPEAIEGIKERYQERSEVSVALHDIVTQLDADFYIEKQMYQQAGIVFCPHRANTDISVEVTHQHLQNSLGATLGAFTGGDDPHTSIKNLISFRDDNLPMMIATKAFGMGIDKPNVRFTVNLNFSSSLESFIQEAGRSGRDRRMSLSLILCSDYHLVRLNSKCQQGQLPLDILRNKWFRKSDFETILKHYRTSIEPHEIDEVTPDTDLVRLRCNHNSSVFQKGACRSECDKQPDCTMAKLPFSVKEWKFEHELIRELNTEGYRINRAEFDYYNPDYASVIHFHNQNFKGDRHEKTVMFNLFKKEKVEISDHDDADPPKIVNGFLDSLLELRENQICSVSIPYNEVNVTDISKAIYRLCCIGLVIDFTQDYSLKRFEIIIRREASGGYYHRLFEFLCRYYSVDRARIETAKARKYEVRGEGLSEINIEIYRCLSYLTDFVYQKISEKRKRGIDDMRRFCIDGLDKNRSWIASNEELKDFIYYYFNSKYANEQYVAENGEPFSLVVDTDYGKHHDDAVLLKYLRVVDDEIVGPGSPLDNVKHLLGAVRYIKRSLTDSNPAITLLEAFCQITLGIDRTEQMRSRVSEMISEGMLELYERHNDIERFLNLSDAYFEKMRETLDHDTIHELEEVAHTILHLDNIKRITKKYLSNEI